MKLSLIADSLLGAAVKRWDRMLRFEGYILDVARGCLRTTDREVTLRPKSFEVLRYLVERARLFEKMCRARDDHELPFAA